MHVDHFPTRLLCVPICVALSWGTYDSLSPMSLCRKHVAQAGPFTMEWEVAFGYYSHGLDYHESSQHATAAKCCCLTRRDSNETDISLA